MGWVLTGYQSFNERFPWISFLKLRGSYGRGGSGQISGSRFPYLTLIDNFAPTDWGYRGEGINERLIGADNLKWEVYKKMNIGMELNLFNDKLTIVTDIFRDERDNIFMSRVTLPDYLGLVNQIGRAHV